MVGSNIGVRVCAHVCYDRKLWWAATSVCVCVMTGDSGGQQHGQDLHCDGLCGT